VVKVLALNTKTPGSNPTTTGILLPPLSKRSESRDGYWCAIKIEAVKFS